jgi:hypothetical protein
MNICHNVDWNTYTGFSFGDCNLLGGNNETVDDTIYINMCATMDLDSIYQQLTYFTK